MTRCLERPDSRQLHWRWRTLLTCCGIFVLNFGVTFARADEGEPSLRVGAAVVDVSPQQFPVAINGGMTARFAEQVRTPVNARAIALQQGDVQVVMVVVDSCMMPRPLLDEAKGMAATKTGIPAENMLISATHTHSAPASMSCLGTDADPEYQAYLRLKLCEAIERAQDNLGPARVGWSSVDAGNFMAVRRWILRPDRIRSDPFGNPTVRANMHAGSNLDDVTGESGPEDPELAMIAFETPDGRPLAVLSNLSMHYFSGVPPVHADYFGLYCDQLAERLAARTDEQDESASPIVCAMSHGCSGDIWRKDYSGQSPERFASISIEQYTQELVDLALKAYDELTFEDQPVLRMAERRLRLDYRVPDAQRLQWARRVVDAMGDRLPQSQEEIYAREQLYLHEAQATEVVLQALRLGEIGMATTPTETYALTGLKIKRQSPLRHTMVLDLANGGDGYIPPPEQHLLGGYNTWAARSAGLDVDAEPRMVSELLDLLEEIADGTRTDYRQSLGPAAEDILERQPLAYWRTDEFSGPWARDASGNHKAAYYEPGVVFFLEGPRSDRFNLAGELNRAAHFAGGRLRARLEDLPDRYAVSLWVWNGMPTDAREVTGWCYARGADFGQSAFAERLGVGGESNHRGKLIVQVPGQPLAAGENRLERWQWHHLQLVRTPESIQVFLDQANAPEIEIELDSAPPTRANELFFGGSDGGQFNWEGRLDEIAIFAKGS